MTRMARPVIGALALALVAAGCGSSGKMSDSARQHLDALVGTVRTAAAAHDGARAHAALGSLRKSVQAYEQAGEISAARASEILAAAARVDGRLSLITTTTTTTTTLPQPQYDHGHDRGKHHGKDKGDGGDEG